MDEADHDLAHLRALDPDRTPRTPNASTPRSRTREASPLPSLQPLRAPRARTTPSPLPTPTDNAHPHPPCAPALVPLESPPSPSPTPAPTPDPLDTPPRPIDPDIIHILQQLRYRRASPSSIQATLARLRTVHAQQAEPAPKKTHPPVQGINELAHSAPHHATPPASTTPDRSLCHSTTSPLPRARSP
jgi:hypothetical protein